MVNGDFESPTVANVTTDHEFETYYDGQEFLGWKVEGGSVDIVAQAYWEAASGVQSIDLTGEAAGSITQEIATTPGETYRLSFALSGNPGWSDVIPLIVTMEFLWHDTVVDALHFDTAGHTVTSMGWTYYEYQLTAVTDRTRLTFASLTSSINRGPALDDVQVVPVLPSDPVCTLPPGYWKTHSELGPAPYDDTWALLPTGASTPFYLSGKTHYQTLWTPPAGSAYFILSHAYIATRLNFLNGADPTAAQAAFNSATTLFSTYTPAQIAALKHSHSLRRQFVALAATLDEYNNGLIGPGHCQD
ncbi:MAG: choice-of-anchor C family protein [Limisphaerales bacterium]